MMKIVLIFSLLFFYGQKKDPFLSIDSYKKAKRSVLKLSKKKYIPYIKKYIKNGKPYQKWLSLKVFERLKVKPDYQDLVAAYEENDKNLKIEVINSSIIFYGDRFVKSLILSKDRFFYENFKDLKKALGVVEKLFLKTLGLKENVFYKQLVLKIRSKRVEKELLKRMFHPKPAGVRSIEVLLRWGKADEVKKVLKKNLKSKNKILNFLDNISLLDVDPVPFFEVISKAKSKEIILKLLDTVEINTKKGDNISYLDHLYKRKDPDILEKLILIAVRAHDKSKVKKILKILKGKNLYLKSLAAWALGQIGDSSIEFDLIDELRKLSRHADKNNFEARKNLIISLGKIGSKNAVPPLIEAFAIPDQQKYAIKEVVRFGKDSLPFLLFIIKSGDVEKEAPAIEALIALGKQASGELAKLLNHPSKSVREKAISLLAIIGDKEQAPKIYELLKNEKGVSEIEVLKTIRLFYYSFKDVFLNMLVDGEIRSRKMVLKTILNMKDYDALPHVEKTLENDKVVSVRNLALRVLWFLNYPGIDDIILKIIQFEAVPIKKEAVFASRFVLPCEKIEGLSFLLKGETKEVLRTTLDTIYKLTGNKKINSRGDLSRWVSLYTEKLAELKEGISKPKKSGFVKVKGVLGLKVYYEIFGNEEKVIVFVPGGPDLGLSYLKDYFYSLKKNFSLIFYDPPARGKSSYKKEFSFKNDVASLTSLINELKLKKVNLFCHGYGGLVCIKYMHEHPDSVDRAIFSNIPVPTGKFIVETMKKVPARLKDVFLSDYEFLLLNKDKMEKSLFLKSLNKTVLFAYFKNKNWIPFFLKYKSDPHFRYRIIKKLVNLNLVSELSSLKNRILILISKYDIYNDSYIKWFYNLTTEHKNFKLKGFSESAHFPFIEENKEFINTITKFLK